MKLGEGPARLEFRVVTTTVCDHFSDLQVTSEEKLCVFLSCGPEPSQRGSQEPLLQPRKSAVKKVLDVITESLPLIWGMADRGPGKEQAQSLSQTKLALLSFYEPDWKLRALQDIAEEDSNHQESVHCPPGFWKDMFSERKPIQSPDNQDALPSHSIPPLPGPEFPPSSCMWGHWTSLLSAPLEARPVSHSFLC